MTNIILIKQNIYILEWQCKKIKSIILTLRCVMNMFPMHVPARGGQFKFMTGGFCKHWHIKVVDNT